MVILDSDGKVCSFDFKVSHTPPSKPLINVNFFRGLHHGKTHDINLIYGTHSAQAVFSLIAPRLVRPSQQPMCNLLTCHTETWCQEQPHVSCSASALCLRILCASHIHSPAQCLTRACENKHINKWRNEHVPPLEWDVRIAWGGNTMQIMGCW